MGHYSEMKKVEYIPIPLLHILGISVLEEVLVYLYLNLASKKVGKITQSYSI